MVQFHIKGTANLASVKAQFAAVEMQVRTLNEAMAETAMASSGGNTKNFGKLQAAAKASTTAYNNALAASGAFRVEQLKINDAVSKNTELLTRQKLGFKATFGKKSKDMMHAIYREQLAMQQAHAKMTTGTVGDGKTRMSLAVPTAVHKSWDTLNARVGMFRARLASASAELVNWGKNTQWAGRQLMVGISLPVAMFGAAAGKMAYDVDKELTRIRKVYDTTANANSKNISEQIAAQKELDEVRVQSVQTATKAAKEYGVAMTDTLGIQADLAATGLTGQNLQKSTSEVMRVATLGEMEYQTALQSTIALQSTFRMNTNELTESFNYMNAVENATSLQLKDFAAAIPIASGPIKAFGGDVKELGVLLTAMRERGFGAVEGANAIKASMQRLARPSKQIQREFAALTGGTDIKSLVHDSENLTEVFTRIYDVTKDLSLADKREVFGGLFGSYQVSRMMAMTEGMGDLEKGVGQVSDAYRLGAQDAQTWADAADQEMKAFQESASGKFKIALESLKAELQSVGDPFLEVASWMLTATNKILKFVNSMPGWAKKGLIFAAMLGAIIGPVVMLIGLFANFAGNIGSFVAWAMRAVTTFEVMNKQQWASKVASELASKGFVEQTSAAKILEAQIRALTDATRQQAIALSQQANIPISSALSPRVDLDLNRQWNPKQQRGIEAVLAKNSPRVTSQLQAQERITERVSGNVKSAAFATAAMGASAALMVQPWSETGQSIGKWAMLATVVVPAVGMISKGMTLVLAKAKVGLTIARQTAMANASAAMATGRMAGAWGTAAAASKGALGAVAGLMGPIGWTLTALGGIVLVAKHFDDAQKKAFKSAIDSQSRLNNAADDWGKSVEKAAKDYTKISRIKLPGTKRDQSEYEKNLEYYSTGEGKETAKSFGELSDDSKRLQAASIYIEMMDKYGASADEARTRIEALYAATGEGAAGAAQKAAELVDQIGELKDIDWSKALTDQIKLIQDSMSGLNNEDSIKMMNSQGQELGQIFAAGFTNAQNPKQSSAFVDQYTDIALEKWQQYYDGVKKQGGELAEFLKKKGIESAEEFSEWYRANDKKAFAQLTDFGIGTEQAKSIESMLDYMRDYENSVIKAAAKVIGLSGDVNSVAEFTRDATIAARGWTFEETKNSLEDLRASLRSKLIGEKGTFENPLLAHMQGIDLKPLDTMQGIIRNLSDSDLTELNETLGAIANARGIKVGSSALETYNNIMNNVKEKTSDAADETDRLANKARSLSGLRSIEIKADQWKSILKDSMSAVQDTIADGMMDGLDRQMNSALDASSSYWDKAIDRLQNAQEAAADRLEDRQDRAMEAFEKRWENKKDRVEEYYDKRIKATEKAIKAEQKAEELRKRIFEAEQARLNRLTESANRGIDFNMALQTGDLDEAAKIRNDMEASAVEWALADADAKSSSMSERRQERLQNKSNRIKDNKDKALKALKEQEDKQKKSLKRQQENEKKHLDKVQKMRLDAMRAQSDAAQKNLRAEWEARKDNLNKQLETFKSFVPKNMKELKAWMNQVGISYNKFGRDELHPTSIRWGKWFKNEFRTNMRDGVLKVSSDNMWEKMAGKTARKTIMGMGFANMGAFTKFVRTGKLPKDFGKKTKNQMGQQGRAASKRGNNPENVPMGTRHTGGWIDGGAGSRKGVARTHKGLHASEQLIRGKRGEFVVNSESAKKHAGLIEAVNNGTYDANVSKNGNIMGGAGTVPGVAGLLAGMANKLLATGVAKSLESFGKKKVAEAMSFGMTGRAGKYGDLTFSAEQMNNAGTIASVGKRMGMTNRDIAIAIMTSIAESSLKNIDYGDRDSVGLFQQRTSQGWGTIAQIMNPEYAARKFYESLRGVTNRTNMAPWLAAQAVQRSAFSDGSNYRQYWDEGQAIFRSLTATGKSGVAGFVQGRGGKHQPIKNALAHTSRRLHGSPPAYDFSTPTGTPIYAVADGVISRSMDMRGFEPRRAGYGKAQDGFRSYGRVIYLKTDAGPEVLYAHLSRRSVAAGQRVKGGAVLGATGDTGNSTGPHLHFGATNGPMAWLKSGGMTLNDGIAMLHRGETVLTKPLSSDLQKTVKAFGKAGGAILDGSLSANNRQGQDSLNSSADSWKKESLVAQNDKVGGWTYISGMMRRLADSLDKSTSKNETSGNIRTATMNFDNTFGQNRRTEMSKLMQRADVMGLSDYSGGGKSKARFTDWIRRNGWGFYNGHGDSPVIWNKDRYKAAKTGNVKFPTGRGPMTAMNYVMLNGAGTPFWAASAHTAAKTGSSARQRALQKQQFSILRKKLGVLGKSAPILLMGDFNEDVRHERTMYDMLPGMTSNWNRGVKHPGRGTLGNRFIDQMFTTKQFKLLGSQIMRISGKHTGASLAQYSIPSHKNGAENIRWDNTLVNMHKRESILTSEQSDKFRYLANNIDKVAAGAGNSYSVNVSVNGANVDEKKLARVIMQEIKKEESRKPQPRRSVKA